MKKIVLTVASVCALSSTAWAGGSKGSLGVGGDFQLSGLGGVSANYDMGEFHVGGFLGFADAGGDDDTEMTFGARFYYHVHSTAMADFGLGGSFGIGLIGNGPGDDNDQTLVYIEPTFQIRAFMAANVALSFTGGLSIGTSDAEDQAFVTQPTGIAGVHYYFF
jgi:hypothetical protein